MPLARRLAVTLGVPLLILLLGEHVLLPGIPEALVDGPGSHAGVGVFALGVAPILTAYWVVEAVAFLVPRWSRLRHGNPKGRAKLEIAVRVLVLALAALQGYQTASMLKSFGGGSDLGTFEFSVSVPVVTMTLVGGVCIQFVAAWFISRQGVLNGLIALAGANLLRGFVEEVAKRLGLGARGSAHLLEPRQLGVSAMATVVMIVATWAALRGAGSLPAETTEEGEAAPVRTARWLAVHPFIPVPSSSFEPYVFAVSLVMLPATLRNFGLPLDDLVAFLRRGDVGFTVVFLVTTGALMAAFAWVVNRPAELADLAQRLGAKSKKKRRAGARDAVRRTLVPSFLLFSVYAIAPARFAGATVLAMLTVALMDLAQAVRQEHESPGFVPVWEERRASAVPVLRAALAAAGVATETRGTHVLGFRQIFAPYAPAVILVKREDAERATEIVGGLAVGEESSEGDDEEAEPAAPGGVAPWHVPVEPWTVARRTAILAACALVALLLAIDPH
jgi:preprotein translocase subunit SecY